MFAACFTLQLYMCVAYIQVFSNHEKFSNILENMVGVVVSNSVHVGWFCCFCLSMN